MQEIHKIQHLLNSVSIISKKYEDIAKITGENFNVFSVLSMERKEVKTHSAFLGELLNPRGSHGLDDIFLKILINQLREKFQSDFEFQSSSSRVIVEEHLGKIKEDKTEGGRADIVIKDLIGNIIVIENKIDAIEQPNQITRYAKAYSGASIFFLTLYGYESKTAGENKYFSISYREDIVNWLEECLKEAVNFPMLREIIKQYINLVKKLTHQTINRKMSNEIVNIIQKDFISASEITKNFQKAKNKILNSFRDNYVFHLEKAIDNKYQIIKLDKVEDKNSKVWFYLKEFKNNNSPIKACFGVEPFSGYGNLGNELFLGIIVVGNENNKRIEQTLKNKGKGWWWIKENFTNISNEIQTINLSKIDLIQYLSDNPNKIEEISNAMVIKTIDFIKKNEKFLLDIHKIIN